MATPIYLPDPFEGINKQLMQLAAMRQAQEAQKEDLKIRQQSLKLQQEEMAIKQQQQATQQASAMQTFLGAVADPNLAPLTQPGLQALGNANQGPMEVNAQINAVAAPQQMGNQVGPSQIDAKRAQVQAERDHDKFMAMLRPSMTDAQFSRFQGVVGLVQAGVPRELVENYIESEKDIADRLKVLQETRGMQDKAAADEYAHKYLADKYGIKVGKDDANQMLQSLILADRAAAQSANLEKLKQRGASEQAIKGEALKIEGSLRDNFEQSPVVKQAQALAYSYGKVVSLAAKKTGASDTALVYAFINMQDQTAAREGEQATLRSTGSVEDRVRAVVGKWKVGTVFTDEQREGLVGAAKEMLDAQKSSLDAYKSWYTDHAAKAGVDPARVVYDPLDKPIRQIEEEAARVRLNNIMSKRVKK